jgi:hypothetical protein
MYSIIHQDFHEVPFVGFLFFNSIPNNNQFSHKQDNMFWYQKFWAMFVQNKKN